MLSSNHAHALLQSSDIKLGTFLYSDCKSYSELMRVSVVTRVFEPYSWVKISQVDHFKIDGLSFN